MHGKGANFASRRRFNNQNKPFATFFGAQWPQNAPGPEAPRKALRSPKSEDQLCGVVLFFKKKAFCFVYFSGGLSHCVKMALRQQVSRGKDYCRTVVRIIIIASS